MSKDWNILIGNAEDKLKELADNSIQCCITSPPYYGLRDYGTGHWEGGDPTCPHFRTSKYSENDQTGHKAMHDAGQAVGDAIYKTVCPLCGAVRVDEQIGLEETPEEYIDRLVAVFHEVKRVLKDDGTLWVNIGDSYATHASGGKNTSHNFKSADVAVKNGIGTLHKPTALSIGLKEKDLIGIPWMLAFALRRDGWYLRQDIIWHKNNPMPESVKDRCVKSHEYVFLLSKSPNYKFNYKDIQEQAITNENRLPGVVRNRLFNYNSKRNNNPEAYLDVNNGIHSSDLKYITDSQSAKFRYECSKYSDTKHESSLREGMHKGRGEGIIYKRYNEPSQDEFVDFIRSAISSQELADKCDIPKTTIDHWYRKDGCGCVPSIEDWVKVRELLVDADNFESIDARLTNITEETDEIGKSNDSTLRNKRDVWTVSVSTYKEAHFATYPEELITPCVLAGTDENDIVLDPFNGSGTTGAVALRYRRKYVGIDLNEDYVGLAIDRLNNVSAEMSKTRLW